ncbi:hypothetical protein FIBSPDRAFT_192998 [Athelia psychrophila]|uniref:Uncharacterized protein n=1 Tax=Athelia psychrophila TaxID=1759441 RepID=A0A166SGY6_9AGAM|nr:hypothetical protein FIBSPDRAFT_192998 [Fibularhizoctonia sp. CBS 109695]
MSLSFEEHSRILAFLPTPCTWSSIMLSILRTAMCIASALSPPQGSGVRGNVGVGEATVMVPYGGLRWRRKER